MPDSNHPRASASDPPAALSVERMQALLDYSRDILSLLDGDGKLLYNSPAAQRIHGFAREEFDGRSTFDFIHPDDAPPVGEVFRRCLAQPGVPVRAVTPRGGRRSVRAVSRARRPAVPGR
ncbi:MAG: two-component sensor histidine kinase [Myxococcaceae bacterium]|nr:two-component sensor histidine kinase [Myxococcaceae bacterium]